MLRRRIGTVLRILRERPGAAEIEVEVEGAVARAICYPELTGAVRAGDSVLLNTVAVSLKLGTGGSHFVMANLSRPAEDEPLAAGHIIKLRYTPLQTAILAVEEEDSPHRAAIQAFESLNGMPVIAGELHSQLAPACGALKRAVPKARIAYIMTDAAALPIALSQAVAVLKERGLLDATITCGQAFGGDLEAVTLHSALVAAAQVVKADAVIVLQGPGNAGTGTTLGFGGIEQGEIVNAVHSLGGRAIAIPRISFADPRKRHRGVSHHTQTALGRIALAPCTIAVPKLSPEPMEIVLSALAPLAEKHRIATLDADEILAALEAENLPLRSMGRGPDADREFFLAAVAAGLLAGRFSAEG